MAITPVSYYLRQPAVTSWHSVAQAPTAGTLIIRHYMICATGATQPTVRMRIVDSGAQVRASIVNDYPLDIEKPINCTQAYIVLRNGDILQAYTDVAGVDFSFWGGYE